MKRSSVGSIIFTVIELLVLAFCVIGTPIAQFKPKWGGYKGCLTLWGAKNNCGSTKYNARKEFAFGCAQRKNNMTGAAVFAIVSIVVTFVLVIFGLLVVLNMCTSFLLPLILSLLATATLLVCWACVAGVYNNSMCTSCTPSATCFSPGKLKNMGYKYGAGFILILIAWCLQVINCVFAFILMFM